MRVKTVAVMAAMTMFAAVAADDADLAAFREARFGMFIHWGLYSQLGGRYRGQTMPYIGEWAQSYFRIPNAEYAELAKVFNPTKFDADDWARQAKAAGMEYVILTTKHHDGFSMFATKASAYNIVDATPFGRDAFGELAAACRRQGLKVGLYYSQALDWHEFDAADPAGKSPTRRSSLANAGCMPWGNTWDWPDATKKDVSKYLKAKVYPQLKELLANYGEIFVVWFDTPFCLTPEMSKELREFVRRYQPHALVNSRIGNGCGDFGSLGDNETMAGKSDYPHECPVTLNDTWGFKWDDHHWKSGYEVACSLLQTISCNANFLLNIGPRPDGRFPDASSDVLAELAAWRRKTGIVIRGAGPTPFAQAMPWGWCTVAKGNVLQLAVRRDWTNGLEICGLRNGIVSCSVPFEKSGDVLTVRLAPSDDAMPRVVRVTLDGAPDIDNRLMPQCGELRLLPAAASSVVVGKGPTAATVTESEKLLVGKACRVTEHGAFTDWHHAGDVIAWKVCFPKAGRYEAWLETRTWAHSEPWVGDRTVEVSVGNQTCAAELKKDRPLPHTVYDCAESRIGSFAVSASGECEIQVRTLRAGAHAYRQDLTKLCLREVRE